MGRFCDFAQTRLFLRGIGLWPGAGKCDISLPRTVSPGGRSQWRYESFAVIQLRPDRQGSSRPPGPGYESAQHGLTVDFVEHGGGGCLTSPSPAGLFKVLLLDADLRPRQDSGLVMQGLPGCLDRVSKMNMGGWYIVAASYLGNGKSRRTWDVVKHCDVELSFLSSF